MRKVVVNHKSLIDKRDYFFLWYYLHQACFVSNVLEKVVDLTNLNIFRTTRAMLMNFCLVDTLPCQVFIWVCKVLCLFQQIFNYKKVRGNIVKRQKNSASKHFLLTRYSKKWLHREIMSPPHSTTEKFEFCKNKCT